MYVRNWHSRLVLVALNGFGILNPAREDTRIRAEVIRVALREVDWLAPDIQRPEAIFIRRTNLITISSSCSFPFAKSSKTMGIHRQSSFNEISFCQHCKKAANPTILVEEHQLKIRAMSNLTAGDSASVALAYLTTGISLIGTSHAISQFHTLFQQIHIIEETLEIGGHGDMPKTRLNDIVIRMLMAAEAYSAGCPKTTAIERLASPIMDGLPASLADLQTQLADSATKAQGSEASHSRRPSLHRAAKGIGHAIHHAAHEVHVAAHDTKVAIRHAAHGVHVAAHDAKVAVRHSAHDAKSAMLFIAKEAHKAMDAPAGGHGVVILQLGRVFTNHSSH